MAKLKLIVDMVNERTRMVADLSTLLTIESKLVSRDVRTRSSFSCGCSYCETHRSRSID